MKIEWRTAREMGWAGGDDFDLETCAYCISFRGRRSCPDFSLLVVTSFRGAVVRFRTSAPPATAQARAAPGSRTPRGMET